MIVVSVVFVSKLVPLTTAQRMSRGRGYSHHFALEAEREKQEEARKKAVEQAENEQKEYNRNLYFRPRSKSSNFTMYDSSVQNYEQYMNNYRAT